MRKVYGTSEIGRFSVIRPTDTVNKPSLFFRRVCRKEVSIFARLHHEVLRHSQGAPYFARDQGFQHETPGWRILDFHGNPQSDDELERQERKTKEGPLVARDREHPFAEDLVPDEAEVVDLKLPILAKVFRLMDVLKKGGSYELVERLWGQFVLFSGRVTSEVA